MAGIPLWLLCEYLVELGGRADGAAEVAGDGWRAALALAPDHRAGSLRVGQVRLTLTGSAAALGALEPLLERKLMRGGG